MEVDKLTGILYRRRYEVQVSRRGLEAHERTWEPMETLYAYLLDAVVQFVQEQAEQGHPVAKRARKTRLYTPVHNNTTSNDAPEGKLGSLNQKRG